MTKKQSKENASYITIGSGHPIDDDDVVVINGVEYRKKELKVGTRNISKEISHSYYRDMEDGNDTETICYPSLICILEELIDRIEQLEKDNELLKSYAWEQ